MWTAILFHKKQQRAYQDAQEACPMFCWTCGQITFTLSLLPGISEGIKYFGKWPEFQSSVSDWTHHSSPQAGSQCQKSAASGTDPKCESASTASGTTVTNSLQRNQSGWGCTVWKTKRLYALQDDLIQRMTIQWHMLLEFLLLIFAAQTAWSLFCFVLFWKSCQNHIFKGMRKKKCLGYQVGYLMLREWHTVMWAQHNLRRI